MSARPSVDTVPPAAVAPASTKPLARLSCGLSAEPASWLVTGSSNRRNCVGNKPRTTQTAVSRHLPGDLSARWLHARAAACSLRGCARNVMP